ncbi:hypothetical protein [Kitasatospora sp. NPDC093806]|uniref:hypothetical protein n=1 Tax=Kitasatospora sp. NPDC093806 TaxID=3155075 RepID=UPI0034279AA1
MSAQAVTAPLPRPEAAQATRPMRERQQTPPPGRAGAPRPGRPRGQARDRQHTPVPGGRPGTARQRLLRQRLVVFVTVTVGVALAIAAAQGCENRENKGLRPPTASVSASAAGGPAAATEQPASAGPGTSADGIAPSTTPLAAAARGSAVAGDGALAPAPGAGPAVDWPNRGYPDPAGGPAITLRDGRSTGTGPQVVLSAVLQARYKGAPAALIVLRRSEGSVPVDLVQLFSFNGDAPVPLTARSSAADPQATATWRLENGALVREERVAQTGTTTSTRYTLRADGTLEESWPGSTATPPPAAAPAPPTAPTTG